MYIITDVFEKWTKNLKRHSVCDVFIQKRYLCQILNTFLRLKCNNHVYI